MFALRRRRPSHLEMDALRSCSRSSKLKNCPNEHNRNAQCLAMQRSQIKSAIISGLSSFASPGPRTTKILNLMHINHSHNQKCNQKLSSRSHCLKGGNFSPLNQDQIPRLSPEYEIHLQSSPSKDGDTFHPAQRRRHHIYR